MRTKLYSVFFFAVLFISACGVPPPTNNSKPANITAHSSPTATGDSKPANTSPTPKPTATQSRTKDGDYPGKGKVTKINLELGSVEMDHEEIIGVMPAMRMEFYVSDKKMLDGLNVGDAIDFTLRYKDRTETVVAVSKAK